MTNLCAVKEPPQLYFVVVEELVSKFSVCYSRGCFLSINTSDCCCSTCAQSWSDTVTDQQATPAKFKFNGATKKRHTVLQEFLHHLKA